MPRSMLLPMVIVLGLSPSWCDAAGPVNGEQKMSSADAEQVFLQPAVAELARAVAKGDEVAIRRLAPQADLNAQGRDGVTLLEWAVLNKRPGSLKALLEVGANPSQQGLDGETVIHLAAQADDLVYLQTLLKAGADANALSRSQTNALVSALDAARKDHLSMLLEAGAKPDQANLVGYTPLHAAAMLRDYDSVLVLLKHGADPRARSKNGATFQSFVFPDAKRVPLNAKAKEGQREIRAWLLANGVEAEGRPQ
ncbi:ankyrin repeat domain-containing protein [Solilutibacter pythonis]|nr:ankyrin repeat domain-containing protein [Lysobacter pythonis]